MLNDCGAVYERTVPLGGQAVAGLLWRNWSVTTRLREVTSAGLARHLAKVRVQWPAHPTVVVCSEHIDVSAVQGLPGENFRHTFVIAEEGAHPEAVDVLESRNVVTLTVGTLAHGSVFDAVGVGQALQFIHLVLSYTEVSASAPEGIPALEEGWDRTTTLDTIRALTGDDFLQFYRHAPQDLVLGFGRFGGTSAALIAHHGLAGRTLREKDLGILNRFLRQVRRTGLPLIWFRPQSLSGPSHDGGGESSYFPREISKLEDSTSVLALTAAEDTVPDYLVNLLSERCLSVDSGGAAGEEMENWLTWAASRHQVTA